MADSRIAYGLAKKHGIDTTGMSPQQVWDVLKEKGISFGADREAEQQRLAQKYDNSEAHSHKSNVHLQLFAAKIADQSEKELKKSRSSIQKRIEEHESKIANPQKEYPDWESYSEEIKQKKLNWWKKEIGGFQKSIKEIDDKLGKK